MGLVVHRVDSRLYSPSQIHDFIKDIEGDLQVVCDTLKAGGNPGKRCAYCLFVDNLSSAMSAPMDPPYCLLYPTSYVKGFEPDHFNTCNSPVGMHLHHCTCHATLQFSNDDPKLCTKYVGSCLILPHGVQYNDWLYLTILEPQNHRGPLIDPAMGEPCPMEVVGNFRAADPIFKGCYGDSLLYSKDDLALLRWQKIYLPTFQGEIPMPPAPSHWKVREPAATKQYLHRAAALDTSVESPKAKRSSSKSGPPYLNSEVPRFYICQETLLSQGINPGRPGEVSTGPQLSQVWPFALSCLRVSRMQTKRSLRGGLQYGQHHSSHWLQHIGHLLQSNGFPQ